MTTVLKENNSKPFSKYDAYVSSLKRLALESRHAMNWDTQVALALNGQVSTELRRVVPVDIRRKYGAFFTGTSLSSQLLDLSTSYRPTSVFYDPTCGMGDLLLAVAKTLPLCKTLSKTLRKWGQQLVGTDIHREFIEGARTRLVLLARQRHKSDEPLDTSYAKLFPHIIVADSLQHYALFKRATHLLLNPPFGQVTSPLECSWASGRISEAARFVAMALEQAKPGTEVLAILPDVLRSGSFSEHWRRYISKLAEVRLIEPYGIFDDNADVDVFLLHLLRRRSEAGKGTAQWPQAKQPDVATISDFFDVHVGRVVPHRDPEIGPRYAYIHSRCVPTWAVMRRFTEKRRCRSVVYQPPFVVIRRTSRPGHPYRATATIIAGKQPVAVENHLIVCQPKSKTLKSSLELMRLLKTETVNKFLNQRICCRHLTVSAVKSIPFQPRLNSNRCMS